MDFLIKSLHIKIHLRQTDNVRTTAVVASGKSGCRRQPSRVTAHDLNDHYRRDRTVIALVVPDNLFYRGSGYESSTCVSGYGVHTSAHSADRKSYDRS